MTALPQVFDRALYLARCQRASADASAALDTHVAGELADRLSVINRSFERALLIAQRPQALRAALLASGKCAGVDVLHPPATDALDLPDMSYDAIFHMLDLQVVNDVPGQLAQVAQALKPDGLALFAFFAGDTLHELRTAWLGAEQRLTGGASPRVAPMIGLRETGALLQRAGLALPVADSDRLHLRYADALALMREVKALGFANPMVDRSRALTSRRLVAAAAAHYPQDTDGRISATIDIAWALAWKPHPSQQQPLKPGSAKARLADALNVREQMLDP